MSGDPPALRLQCSTEERTAIDAFKPRVADAMARTTYIWRTDAMMLRFLRARKFNLDAAEAMYRDVIQWRADNKVDEILTTYKEPEVMARFCYGGLHGVDLDGNALLIDRSGAM